MKNDKSNLDLSFAELKTSVNSVEFKYIMSNAGITIKDFKIYCSNIENLTFSKGQITKRRNPAWKRPIEVIYINALINLVGEDIFIVLLKKCRRAEK